MLTNINKILKEFNKKREWESFHTPENLIKSISIEAAELLELVQWSSTPDLPSLKDECADILIYLFILLQKYEINIEEMVLNKISKNAEKYPIQEVPND